MHLDDSEDRALLDRARSVVLIWSRDGRIQHLNQYAEHFFGHPTSALIGQPILGRLLEPRDSLGRDHQAMLEHIAAAPERFEQSGCEVIGRGGQRRYLIWTHAALHGPREPLLLSIGSDITDFREQVIALDQAERRLAELTEHLEQCVWVKDREAVRTGEMNYMSPAFERIYGIPVTALHGNPGRLYEMVHEDDRALFREVMEAQFEREYDIEYRIRRPDGELRWVWSRSVLIRGPGGAVVRLVGLTEDVTAHKQAELRIQQLNAELEQAYARERELSRTDELTGLGNRKRYNEEITRLWRLAAREAQKAHQPRSLAIIHLDVDHLKPINDRHGHAAGDACLRAVAQVLRRGLREIDVAARTGGDEFIAVLPNTALEEALDVAERLAAALRREQVVVTGPGGEVQLAVSASFGVAAARCEDPDLSPEALYRLADGALYRAKAGGRDRVERQ